MANKRPDRARPARPEEEPLDPFPGITGDPVEPTTSQGNTGGLFDDAGDGTIGEITRPPSERPEPPADQGGRQRNQPPRDRGESRSVGQATTSGTNSSSGNPVAGGVAVGPGRGSDVGTIGPSMRDDLGGGLSGGTMGGERETDVGGGLSGAPRSGIGSGRDPDFQADTRQREGRKIGAEDDEH